tara:strand:- start:2447 stop:2944 length:498 start_codon:yes stop_codon:yes gene_type:complete
MNDDEDFRTPRDLFSHLDNRFNFTLDVAASDKNKLCPSWFTRAEDGLKQEWTGSVWCNPPYSDPASWIAKGLSELELGNCESVVYLINVDSSTIYFHDLIMPNCQEIHLIKGRLNFGGPNVIDGGSNPRPSMIVVFYPSTSKIQYLNCIETNGFNSNVQLRITSW